MGQPGLVLRGGVLAHDTGWRDRRDFTLPPPLGRMHGHLFETADPLTLPTAWPSLCDVAF